MRKLANILLLVSILGTLTGVSIVAGTARAQTGHVVTIGDVTTVEGNGNGVGTAAVTVQVDPAPELGERVKVDFGTSAQAAQGATATTTVPGDGTPVFPEDFAQTDGTVTFDPFETTQTMSIPVLRDNADESNEIFYVQLFDARGECSLPIACPSDATIGDARATVTISDDDATPVLSIGDVTHDEGNGPGDTSYDFTVTKAGGSASDVTVSYGTADASSTQPGDYASRSGTLTFAASSPSGSETRTVGIAVHGDTTFEPSETFTVDLSDATNATISDGEGVGTIGNDDVPPPPAMAVSDASNQEGDPLNFALTLSSPPKPGQTAVVEWTLEGTTGDGNATEGSDYLPTSGTVAFTAGETEQSISVPTIEDVSYESNEVFGLRLTQPEAPGTGGYTYNISRDLGVGTITNDDPAPSLSIDDVTVDPEAGPGDISLATFTVTKTGQTAVSTTVSFETADVSANAGDDYIASSGEVSFGPEETQKQITVQVKGDALDEIDESFDVGLADATDATIGDAQGVGTIKDDDAASATFAIGDVTVTEGNSGTTAANLTVTKSGQTAEITSVDFETANGTAKNAVDYNTSFGSLTFAPEETTKIVAVEVRGDTLDELNETFFVNLSDSTSAPITDGQAIATITDNDAAPTVTINDGKVNESSSAACVLTVKLGAASGREIRVHYTTASGRATGNVDYLAKHGDLKFVPGDVSEQIKILARSDTKTEGPEGFYVKLSAISPSGSATFKDATGICQIIDND